MYSAIHIPIYLLGEGEGGEDTLIRQNWYLLFLDQEKIFFHNPFVGHCMYSLGRSYMLITSGSLRVKQLNSIV